MNFNRKLRKRVKGHSHVRILDTDLDRSHFTRHGLHMNTAGKEELARKSAALLNSMLQKDQPKITLNWKDDRIQEQTPGETTTVTTTRASTRPRRGPTHADDFLWGLSHHIESMK